VQFRITPHSGHDAPPDAIELLWRHLDDRGEEVSFAKVGPEIEADTGEDAVSMTRDERAGIGRRLILGVLREVCEGAPELQSDWFAVSSEL
jgi:hypothetical protein